MSPNFTGKTFLVVDDEPMLCEILKDIFESYGAKVFEAYNGVDAYKLLEQNQVDVVVSDIRMPGGDGISLLEKIKERNSATPRVFMITGFTDFSRKEILEKGATELFYKPFDLKTIVESIRQYLLKE